MQHSSVVLPLILTLCIVIVRILRYAPENHFQKFAKRRKKKSGRDPNFGGA